MPSLANQEAFLFLVRLGIGHPTFGRFKSYDWNAIEALAEQHGLLAVIVDGIDYLPENQRPPKMDLLQWVGLSVQDESKYVAQWKTATEMAHLFHRNYIRTYVLKGMVVAECYPKPEHRVSADMDCYLLPKKGDYDAWTLGNNLVKAQGYKVSTGFYKNSTFYYPDLSVENHQYMVPFRGNKTLKNLELLLQNMIREDKGEDKFEGTWLYRPPVMVSVLFLVEHAYSHFLHEGLTWRHILDWMMFRRKHKDDIDWNALDYFIDEFGFRRFYDSFVKLGSYLLGEIAETDLTEVDKKMLADVWAPLDLHETVHGVKGKIALAGNTLRAWWKYHYFAPISMPHALWIQVKGCLFDKNPRLS